MDHLTPVKTALLVERQALSARRGKCYAASQFSPSFPLSLTLSLPLPCSSLSPTLVNSPPASLSLSPFNLLLIPPLLLPIYLFSHFLTSLFCSDTLLCPFIFVFLTLDTIFTLLIFKLNSKFPLSSSSSSTFQIICAMFQSTSDTNMNRQ